MTPVLQAKKKVKKGTKMNTHLKLAYDYGVQQALAEAVVKISGEAGTEEESSAAGRSLSGLVSGAGKGLAYGAGTGLAIKGIMEAIQAANGGYLPGFKRGKIHGGTKTAPLADWVVPAAVLGTLFGGAEGAISGALSDPKAGIKTSNFLTPKEDLNPYAAGVAGLASGGLAGGLGGYIYGNVNQHKQMDKELSALKKQKKQLKKDLSEAINSRPPAPPLESVVEQITGHRPSPEDIDRYTSGVTLDELDDFMRKAERPRGDVIMDAIVGGVGDVVDSMKELAGKLLKRVGKYYEHTPQTSIRLRRTKSFGRSWDY